MASRSLDLFIEQDSLVHRLEGSVKLALVLGFLLTTALLPVRAWLAYACMLVFVGVAAWMARIPKRVWLGRSLIAAPFALAALPLLFTQPGEPLFSFNVFQWHLTASQPGLARFLSIFTKTELSVMAAIVLTATTPLPDLLKGMRRMRLPRLLTAMIGLMWRYLFMMVDEAERLMTARSSRSGCPDNSSSYLLGFLPTRKRQGGSLAWRARVTGGMAGSLFLRSIERSERVYAAMLARGYDGEVRSLPLPRPPLWNRIVLGFGLTGLSLVFLLSLLL